LVAPASPLFTWFHHFLEAGLNRRLPSDPVAILASLHLSDEVIPWVRKVGNESYPLKEASDGLIPDLETRHQSARRSAGQFYTPEPLIRHLLERTQLLSGQESLLDPACGDGAFLIQSIAYLKRLGYPLHMEHLHGWDIDRQALFICLGRLLKAGEGKELPNLVCRDFLLDPPAMRFNVIVSNPPYRVNLSADLKARLHQEYETAEGEKDLYTFFLEGGLKALSPNGQLLMLTSHTFLVNHQCQKIRDMIFGRHQVESLFLLPTGFFRKAPGVIPVVIQARQAVAQSHFSVFTEYQETTGWQNSHTGATPDFLLPTGLRRTLRPPDRAIVFARMEKNGVRLGDVAVIGVGIQEANVRGTKVSPFVLDQPTGRNPVKVLKGREIAPFCVKWEGKYLDYGPHLTYAGNPEIFRNPKILYQNLRHETLERRLVATLDTNGFFPKNSLSYICRPQPPYSLEFILGVLNSDLINEWFRDTYFSFHITVTQVRSIPLPKPSAKKLAAVAEIVGEILLDLTSNHTPSPEKLNELNRRVLISYSD
jgi:hypothetical protein